ncbi:hybrid sensor histidine kinase/response regulator transcription factor [Reichenbachiella ulvae]|uniref:histidine kinase n=1 Tax=Reichenbachiella ulvae TaxID=2980104 RepID=A0ABT3CSS3_9BACT|nr:hybrid sensor histidine kinase/response regulator transcription factor [Reichenbachiella ulvae]MCV9386672.1 ATP-binding protein [Reichenbachiella ulvae]
MFLHKERYKGLKYFFVVFFFSSLNLWAQSYEFETFSKKDGLSDNNVNCIYQDYQGFMWFGTDEGLNRFDGYEFKKYRHKVEDAGSLTSNIIQSITQDQNQDFWIGTADGGLNLLQNANDEILSPQVFGVESSTLDQESVNQVAMMNGFAMVLTKEELFFFKKKENTYQHVKVNELPSLKTGSLYTNCYQEVGEKTYLIGTKQGLKKLCWDFENEQLKASISNVLDSLNIYRIVPFRKGHLIYCLHDSLYYANEELFFEPIVKKQINCLTVEDDEHVWVGTDMGLEYLTFENDTSLSIASIVSHEMSTTENVLGGISINTIFEDRTGMLWLGTNEGVTKVFERPKKFDTFYENHQNDKNTRNRVNCFLEDSEAKLWVGTSEGTLFYHIGKDYTANEGSFEVLNLGKPYGIRSLSEVKLSGESYIIVANDYSTKVQILDLKGNQIKKGRLRELFNTVRRPINALVSDEKYIWVGTKEGGLYRYSLVDNGVKHFLVSDTSNLCSNLINSLFISSESDLYIGTNRGLNILPSNEQHKSNPTFQRFTHLPGDKGSLSYNHITAILQDSNQKICIGTLGGGLNQFDVDKNTFSCLTTSDGLVSDCIKGVVLDSQQQLWLSSSNGLSSYNQNTNQITNFSTYDGLQDSDFSQGACITRKNGEILFGGKYGVNFFYPQSLEKDSTEAELVLTALYLVSPVKNEDIYFTSAKLLKYVNDSTKIQFDHTEQSFTVHFSSLNYDTPAKIEYKYRLVGFEKEWNSTSHLSRFAKYTNLHPGEYIIEVTATNSDGVWMEKPLQLNIEIAKAWYQNNVAIAAYMLIVLMATLFFTRYSFIRNKVKRDLMMEHIEKEKTELLTQYKLSFFTNVSHELRTPITIIKSYFESIAPNWRTMPLDKVNKELSIISRNVNTLNHLINQLLDFRKLEQDKMELLIEYKDIVPLIESRVASFQILAKNKNVDLHFRSEANSIEFYFDEDKMEKIINNLLSNAVKYSIDGGNVNVRLKEINNDIAIEVEDNGVGISEDVQNTIFERFSRASMATKITQSTGIGLNLTKGLVELHGGRIELASKKGEGSIFFLFFPKDANHLDHPMYRFEAKPIEVFDQVEQDGLLEGELNTSSYSNRTILIVEDNEDLLSFLSDKLRDHFNVLSAKNGQIGLKSCIENNPDLVISDIMMPEMNGYELCNAIKNDDRVCHIPIVLLTAKTNHESELHGFKLGADAYVGKPFDFEIIVARIVSIFYSRQQLWKRIADNPFFKPDEIDLNTRDEQFMRQINNTIEEYMASPEFSVEMLARQVDISKNNLNTKIKALTGKTSVQFIRLLRLHRAAMLLKAKDSRVSQVTYQVGYTDLQHFRDHFKKEFSVTPSEFKEQQGSKLK